MWFNRSGQYLCDVGQIAKYLKGKKNYKKSGDHLWANCTDCRRVEMDTC